MTSEDILKDIDAKLNVMIKLQALEVVKGRTLTEQVQMLDNIGMAPSQIASCLGKTPNNVRVALYEVRKKKNERNKK